MSDGNSAPRRQLATMGLDLSGIQIEPVKASEQTKTAAKELAQEQGFTARHSSNVATQSPAAEPEIARRGRKRVQGRTTQFTVKLKPETNNAIYRIAEEIDATALAVVIERAVEALEKELAAAKSR